MFGYCNQHFLYFFPLPHGHGSLRPTFPRLGEVWMSRWRRRHPAVATEPREGSYSHSCASITIAGIELMHRIRKGQFKLGRLRIKDNRAP
jgi:hypothetical protein